jgi:hypothetical protein
MPYSWLPLLLRIIRNYSQTKSSVGTIVLNENLLSQIRSPGFVDDTNVYRVTM